jgi:hypothetical protein
MVSQFYFNTYFINILYQYLLDKNLLSTYKLDKDAKYTINYVLDIILNISSKTYSKYKLPLNIVKYFNLSEYSLFSKNIIKNFIKKQIIKKDNTYIIIGVNPTITELTVII